MDITEKLRCRLPNKLADEAIAEIVGLRDRAEQHDRSDEQVWQAIPDEFKLSPTDGGGVDTHFAIVDMAKEIERLREENRTLRSALRGTQQANDLLLDKMFKD